MPNKVTITAVHERDLKGFLESCGMKEEVKKDEFICAGCGRTMKMNEIATIKSIKPYPTVKLYGGECSMKVRED